MSYCTWENASDLDRAYHDNEWGIAVHDDRLLFEYLVLECMQCGLSWELMLRKREIFRDCFDGFDFERMARYTEADIERIISHEGMIRSPRKAGAMINNARCFENVREEFGTFDNYLWSFCGGATINYRGHDEGLMPTKNALSERLSRDLRKRGFKYVGAVVIYSFLQACGVINDHDKACPQYDKIVRTQPCVEKEPDGDVF